MHLKVKEIFYSLQGEGGRAGSPSIFIRLAHCNLNCWFCDTDWEQGIDMTVEQIKNAIFPYNGNWIVWTGGEPTMQLTEEIVNEFPEYLQAIETNGTRPVPKGIDYIAISPKEGVDVKLLHKNFPLRDRYRNRVDEYRYIYGIGEAPPPNWNLLPSADRYYISPIFMGAEKSRLLMDDMNVAACVDYILKNPIWSLSLQMHKIVKIK